MSLPFLAGFFSFLAVPSAAAGVGPASFAGASALLDSAFDEVQPIFLAHRSLGWGEQASDACWLGCSLVSTLHLTPLVLGQLRLRARNYGLAPWICSI